MKTVPNFSRKEFLRLSGLGISALALRFWSGNGFLSAAQDFPQTGRLGRVVSPLVTVRVRPTVDSPEVAKITEDTVVSWLQETVGYTPYRNQRWVETPAGYIWSPFLQPVKNVLNRPIDSLPDYGNGQGMWMEVTVPYVEAELANPDPQGFRIKYLMENSMPIRFYYSQIFWIDDIRADEQTTEYHVRELYGSRGDHFWVPAEAFKPIFPEDANPISPGTEDKQIVVNVARQTLSCYESGREVYFCRVSTGRMGDQTETPIGDYFQVFMKFFSTHMEGGTTGAGYDLSGIGWVSFIATGGIAIHSTYWHNNFGERTSAGCVNASPADAKFVYRWSAPKVPYYPGKLDQIAGTSVRIVEG
jgi:hypothetical protein